MQNTDFTWYVNNLKKLYEQYGPVYVAIKNKKVLGAYPTYGEGVRKTLETEPIGTFIVQQCGPGEEAYTHYIASANVVVDGGHVK